MQGACAVPMLLEIIRPAGSIERITNRACNVAAHLIYFVRGDDVHHRATCITALPWRTRRGAGSTAERGAIALPV